MTRTIARLIALAAAAGAAWAQLTINTLSPLPAATIGTIYSETLSASGDSQPGTTYSWAVTIGSLPDGLSLDPNSGTISGTPLATATTQTFTVQVSDNAVPPDTPGTAQFTLPVNLVITTTTLPKAAAKATYPPTTLQAEGGLPPYNNWTAVGLPANLNLDSSTGIISGVAAVAAGNYPFTVTVQDSTGLTSPTQNLQLIVAPALSVSTATVPNGELTAPYPATTLAAQGGTAPYSNWTIASGALPPGLALNLATGAITGTPTTTAGSPFTFTVTVQDSFGNTSLASAPFTITVIAGPMITTTTLPAGTVGTPYSQTLAATGGSGTYTWSIITGALPSNLSLNATSGLISGSPTKAGTANFTVQATDSNQGIATAALSITINPAIQITTTTMPPGTVGVSYSQALAATGGSGTYTWAVITGSLPANLTLNSTTGVISGQPTTAGISNFTVQATDTNQATATAALALTINAALSITTVSPLPVATIGASYSETLAATGGSGTYTWAVASGSTLPSGLSLAAATGLISGQPNGTAGPASFTIVVTDTNQVTASKQFSLTINPALSITTNSPLPAGTVGVGYSVTLIATGGSGSYTWSVTSGSLPGGLSLAPSSGAITGQPNAAGAANFTVQVSDSNHVTASKQFALTIDQPLAITTTSPLANGIVGAAYNQTLAGTGGATPYTWSITSGALPGGLSLASSAGTISGQPNAAGTFQFTIQLKDSTTPANIVSKQFVITVSSGLTITSQPTLPNATVGVAYSQTLQAAGGAPPYTWSITQGSLPVPLSFNTTTGQITGIPASSATGQVSFTVKVTDAALTTATQIFSLTVVAAPVITTSPTLPNGTAGAAYTLNLAASGGTPPYKWAVISGSLPGGLSLSAAGAITGTAGAAGTYSFKVQLTDTSGVTASRTFTLTIVASLSINTKSPLPTGEVNIAYSQTLTATGGTSPYKWSVISGTVPGGLTVNSNGSITGTPSAAGTFSFTVEVTDANKTTATTSLSVTIAAAVTISTPATLASGSVGSNYSQTLQASSGVSPYVWTLLSGSLPHGLTLTSAGIISGAPTATGTFNFTARVNDSLGATASRQFTIVVVTGVTISTPAVLPGATVNVAYSFTLQAAGGSGSYTWNITGGSLPAGITLGPGGNVAGVPTAVGPATFSVQVTDSLGHTATEQMSLTVASVLTITTNSLAGATVGGAYSQSLAAAGGTAPYSWSLLNGSLPNGLTLSAGGTITGTATAGGTFAFTVKVTDNAGVIAIKQLAVTVAAGVSITTSTLPDATLNASYSQTLAATGGTPPYTWAVTSGALPGGLNLSAGGVISGTPNTSGTFQFTIGATDSANATASQQFTLVVSGGLTVGPSTLPSGTIGQPYSQTLTAVGGTAPYTFSVSVGSLPPGIALKGAALSGTPTTKGTYQFTIQASDSKSAIGTQQFTIVIAPIGITTPSALPTAAVGTAYSQTLAASGTPPYTWTVTQGKLPAGLSLNSATGAISGTPTASGTSSVTIRVTDSSKATATAAFSISVISGAFSGVPATASSAQQLTGSFALDAQFAQEITGQVTLSFQPDASVNPAVTDPAIQFITGGTSASFTIAANSTAPVSLAFQTGTIAGAITLAVTWQSGGSSLAVPAALTQTIQIAPAVPSISNVTASSISGGFQVVITAFSNTREVTQANLQFTAASGQTLQTTSVTVPLSSESSAYFGDSGNNQYGSQFVLTLPFTVTDGSATAVASVSVQLVNTKGTSTSSSATFE